MATAVITAGVLHQFLPGSFRASPHWVYPVFLGLFLAVLIIGDPGRIDRQRRWLRWTTEVMIALITVVNASAAVRLVVGILDPGQFTSAGELLAIGCIIWVTIVIAFALWFWDLDSGGAAARASEAGRDDPAFLFPEMAHPPAIRAGWYPQFVDYLAVSFNTATAFGPSDVSAVKRWAKLMVIAETLISLALAALVVARAVNIL